MSTPNWMPFFFFGSYVFYIFFFFLVALSESIQIRCSRLYWVTQYQHLGHCNPWSVQYGEELISCFIKSIISAKWTQTSAGIWIRFVDSIFFGVTCIGLTPWKYTPEEERIIKLLKGCIFTQKVGWFHFYGTDVR